MFVHLTKRIIRIRLFNKRANTNDLPAERFKNCSLNIWSVCNPRPTHYFPKCFDNPFEKTYNPAHL
ncbi:hypothetical protein Hanom_Chr06g00571151 [Helianthus anomalus]